MTTKKNIENTEDKCNGKSACPFKKDESINNYYYDYHYTYDKPEKEPLFHVTDRGHRILGIVASVAVGVIGAIVIFAVITSNASVRRIEKMLDKTPVSVHTAPSINHHTK